MSQDASPPSGRPPTIARILGEPVFAGGATQPFGALTLEHVRERAAELRTLTGWGPTARVGRLARGWRELALAMERAGAATVRDLPAEELVPLSHSLWVTLGGP